MPPRKAEGIALASVARSVEAAVKIAAARQELAVDRDTLLNRWEIIGRRLRDVADMDVAYRFASDVTRRVRIPGVRLEPVVTRIGGDILVGFVERARKQMILPR